MIKKKYTKRDILISNVTLKKDNNSNCKEDKPFQLDN